jgi:hypothetical protein
VRKRWSWVDRQEEHYAKVEADRVADAAARAADRKAFYERHEARAKEAEPIDVERVHPGVADGVSYSLGDPEAGRVMRQMRADADEARRAHGDERLE